MNYTYYTHGTCSSQIDLQIDEEGILREVMFTGGCHGNLQGIATLVRGMKAQEVADRLQGIRCGYKNTSCPDQLATAIHQALSRQGKNKSTDNQQ